MSATAKAIKVKADNVPAPLETGDSRALMAIIDRAAMSGDFDVAKLEKLMEMKERWDANEARKAFVADMAAFKANPPEIFKKKLVSFTTRDGDTTSYKHAELSDITEAVLQPLAAQGFSHRWEVKQDGSNLITVTCILTHRLGHSESATQSGMPDDSGKKNRIQQAASAITYLERYTLLAITGLAAKGIDDDAASPQDIEYVSAEQVADLQALLEEVGADKAKFLKYVGAESLEGIRASAYSDAVRAIERKRK